MCVGRWMWARGQRLELPRFLYQRPSAARTSRLQFILNFSYMELETQVFFSGFYFYFQSVDTPIFKKYRVGCYLVSFNSKKYSVLYQSVYEFLKSTLFTRFWLFVFKRTRLEFIRSKFSKKYSFGQIVEKYQVFIYSILIFLPK